MIPILAITAWWYTYPSEKYEFVSWDDDITDYQLNVIKFHGSSHHQPDKLIGKSTINGKSPWKSWLNPIKSMNSWLNPMNKYI